ncbi:MAG: DUF1772 domain-containing protein [Tepidiformaceae bacterium]
MPIRAARFLSLLFGALALGTTLAHVLERPAKLQYPAALWITIQHTLYAQFGQPNLIAYVEPAAIACALALAILLLRRPRPIRGSDGRAAAIAALTCLVLAFPLVYYWLVEPVNVILRSVRPSSPPSNWSALREQWETGQAIRFFLHLLGFSLLVLSALEEPERRVTVRDPGQTWLTRAGWRRGGRAAER